MIRAIVAIAAVTLMLPVTQSWAQQGSGLKSQEDKVSYSIGLSVGRNLKRQGIAVDPDPFLLGVRDAMGGAEPRLSNEEMRAVMHAFQTQMREKQEQDRAAKAKANQDAGRAFLDANKGKKGVVTTTTGLQYRVLTAGTGASPTMQDTVTAHYKGTLLDGTVFDSSYARGQPAQFPVNGVIPGWSEVLQLMKAGGKWRVWIPSELAYGAHGAGERIGPHATLIFEIELIKVSAP